MTHAASLSTTTTTTTSTCTVRCAGAGVVVDECAAGATPLIDG